MSRAGDLLRAGQRLYDDPNEPLAELARSKGWRGFAGGACFMDAAIRKLRLGRGAPLRPMPPVDWERLGLRKYGEALVVAGGFGALLLYFSAMIFSFPLLVSWVLAGVVFVLSFYAVEAGSVFLFPLQLDPQAVLDASKLQEAAGGRVSVMLTTMALAAHMLSGGFRGQGWLRSWCVGCLAVVIWYEQLHGRRSTSVAEASCP